MALEVPLGYPEVKVTDPGEQEVHSPLSLTAGKRDSVCLRRGNMASITVRIATQKVLEDPLALLPCSSIAEFKKGQLIYNQDQPSTNIYLVIEGKVKVSRMGDDGRQVVVDIYQPDEFFGESAFLDLPQRSEQAAALDN